MDYAYACMEIALAVQGLAKRWSVLRLGECCRQSQAEVVSKSRNKIHKTLRRFLYIASLHLGHPALTVDVDHAAAATPSVEQVAAAADADGPEGVSDDGPPSRLLEPSVFGELSCWAELVNFMYGNC